MRPVYASDIYALGATCLFLLTGKSPKELDYDPTTGELLWRSQVKVSEHFGKVLARMLEVSVRHRFQTAKEVLQILDYLPPPQEVLPDMSAHLAKPTVSEGEQLKAGKADSPALRAALAIREQQARLGFEDEQLSSGSHKRVSATGRGGTGHSRQRDSSQGRRSPMGDSTPIPGLHPGTTEGRLKKLSAASLQKAYQRGQRDFANHDLSHLVLRKFNLAEALFHQSSFQNTDFQGANLYNTNFGRASLTGAILRNCNLSHAYFSYANLEGADLRGANLSYAYLSNANLRGTNLYGANLTGATLSDDQLALARTNWSTTLPNGKRGGGLW